ncbi:MAG: GH92 family glycosyl hydrolase [Bacteroidota bacterium]
MQQSTLWIFLCFILAACTNESKIVQNINIHPIHFVDPFIGTGFHGHTFPGATLPFGMIQLSPDTRLPGWDASSGYHYSDSTIYGFSHTHLSGTGIGDLGDVLLLPFTGEYEDGMTARFDKADEKATVGYYQVQLKDFDILAELTATERTGMHRYTFPENANKKLLIDLGHVLQPDWGHKSISGSFSFGEKAIGGERISSGWANDHRVYFDIQFSQEYRLEFLMDGNEKHTKMQPKAKELKAILSFPKNAENELVIKVGISPVSAEGAAKNLAAENPNWDFDIIQKDAENAWQKELQKIQIQSNDTTILTNFYTALYHSMLSPMLAQDVDGQYRGMDKNIHQAKDGFVNYTVFSLWDTFRALHPLMTIIDEDRTNAWMRSLLRKYEEGGALPKWPLASNYTGTMIGYPAASVLADAWSKGITDFDTVLAVEAAVFSSQYHPEALAELPEPRKEQVMPIHLKYIDEQAWIPEDQVSGSVSYGLECSYYDWCIAQMAKRIGKTWTVTKYMQRAQYFEYYFDTARGFMRPKLSDGSWQTPFSPYFADNEESGFIEGNSWQWSWFVPHNPTAFVNLMGGKEKFAAKLDSLFIVSSELEGENAPNDITGLIGQYAHGNEPSHHVAYLYHFADQPEKTQHYVDKILRELYEPTPAGISGNEDCGAMSAWYVLNALGFYQVCPGKPIYHVGRPTVDRATIQLPNGNQFKIVVENNNPSNKYVKSVTLNGKALEDWTFSHEELKNGGELKFVMQSK